MDTPLIVVITAIVAFWFGFTLAKTARFRRFTFVVRIIIAVLAIAASLGALSGLWVTVSPSSFMGIVSKLPTDLQTIIGADLLMGGVGNWLWGFGLLAGSLWWLREKV